MGSLAYVGGDQAVADLSKSKVSTFDLFNVMTGKGAFLLWRSFYFSEQCRYCRTCAQLQHVVSQPRKASC